MILNIMVLFIFFTFSSVSYSKNSCYEFYADEPVGVVTVKGSYESSFVVDLATSIVTVKTNFGTHLVQANSEIGMLDGSTTKFISFTDINAYGVLTAHMLVVKKHSDGYPIVIQRTELTENQIEKMGKKRIYQVVNSGGYRNVVLAKRGRNLGNFAIDMAAKTLLKNGEIIPVQIELARNNDGDTQLVASYIKFSSFGGDPILVKFILESNDGRYEITEVSETTFAVKISPNL